MSLDEYTYKMVIASFKEVIFHNIYFLNQNSNEMSASIIEIKDNLPDSLVCFFNCQFSNLSNSYTTVKMYDVSNLKITNFTYV